MSDGHALLIALGLVTIGLAILLAGLRISDALEKLPRTEDDK